ARVVLTQGFTRRPRCTALRASSAAVSITDGFDVFVQLVIAAITTCPWSTTQRVPSANVTGTGWVGRPGLGAAVTWWGDASSPLPAAGSGSDDTIASANIAVARSRGTRSWGRDGPARLGTTVERSSSSVSENVGVASGSNQSPCSLAYASTSVTCSSVRPVKRR